MSTDRKLPIAHSSEKQSTTDHAILPVIQEFVRVQKETIETGRVIASKTVKNEVEDVSMTLDTDDVTIERVPIGEYIESGTPESRYEGDMLIIPVVKEELVIEKRLVLVEEIRIRKRTLQTEFSEQVTLRKEEVDVKHEKSNEVKN